MSILMEIKSSQERDSNNELITIISMFYEGWAFQVASGEWRVAKNLPANAGDTRDVGSVLGSGRSCGVRHGNLLQYSCLENFLDRGDCWVTVHGFMKIQICLSKHAHTSR